MNISEFNQLPEPQQRKALLVIALGGSCTLPHYVNENIYELILDDEQIYRIYLRDWKPVQDGALMWRLVKEMANFNYYEGELTEQALIAAYIAADPKGLIQKWRNENG